MSKASTIFAILGGLMLASCGSEGAPAPEEKGDEAPAMSFGTMPEEPESTGGAAKETRIASTCDSAEQTVFSCPIPGGDRLNVCSVLSDDGKLHPQYRFGPAGGEAEMVLPRMAGTLEWEWASVPYSGGGEAQVRFVNGEYDYVVFSRVVRTRYDGEGNEPQFTDGVVVRRNGEAIATRICDGQADVALAVTALGGMRPGGSDLFVETAD